MHSETEDRMIQQTIEVLAKGWTQGAAARDKDNVPVPFHDPDATCWCLIGACGRAAARLPAEIKRDWTDKIAKRLGFPDAIQMIIWNDRPGRTKAEVISRLEAAL